MAPSKSTWTEQARAIAFDPSGLIVVKSSNVQKALEELDAYLSNLDITGGSGSPGVAGESAYQEWLESGHTGTQAEFLASLVGPQGIPGQPGDKGDKGDKGDQGDPGIPGVKGDKGDKGDPGNQGPAGTDGNTELVETHVDTASSTFTTIADLAGASITFTVGVRPVIVEAVMYVVTTSQATGQVLAIITDENNTEKARALTTASATINKAVGTILARERITAAGTYTRKIRVSNNATGGTVTVYGGGSFSPSLRAVQV